MCTQVQSLRTIFQSFLSNDQIYLLTVSHGRVGPLELCCTAAVRLGRSCFCGDVVESEEDDNGGGNSASQWGLKILRFIMKGRG